MLQRGRKSLANVTALRVDGKPSRLAPPPHLNATERKLFTDLVAATNAKHFTESDSPLLVSYVQATLLSRRAIKKAGRDARALSTWEKACRMQAVIATKLRLAPQSRIDRKAVTRHMPRPGPMRGSKAGESVTKGSCQLKLLHKLR
jgi:hypothetical protein